MTTPDDPTPAKADDAKLAADASQTSPLGMAPGYNPSAEDQVLLGRLIQTVETHFHSTGTHPDAIGLPHDAWAGSTVLCGLPIIRLTGTQAPCVFFRVELDA